MPALLVQGHSPQASASPPALAQGLDLILEFSHLLRDSRLTGARVRIWTQGDPPPPSWRSAQKRHREVKGTEGKGFLERLPPPGMTYRQERDTNSEPIVPDPDGPLSARVAHDLTGPGLLAYTNHRGL